MTKEIKITIQLFGGLRQYKDDNLVSLTIVPGMTVDAIKLCLGQLLAESVVDFDGMALINRSALANETRILGPNESINSSCALAILPPVCGG